MDLSELKIDPEFAEKIPRLTDEEFAARWLAEPYKPKGFEPGKESSLMAITDIVC